MSRKSNDLLLAGGCLLAFAAISYGASHIGMCNSHAPETANAKLANNAAAPSFPVHRAADVNSDRAPDEAGQMKSLPARGRMSLSQKKAGADAALRRGEANSIPPSSSQNEPVHTLVLQ